MSKHVCALAISSLLGASLGACHQPSPATPARSRASVPVPVPVPAGPNLTDRAIRGAVEDRLKHDPGVDAGKVEVTVSQGVVELTGSVDLLSKARAARVAEAVKGVRVVSDRLALFTPKRSDPDIEQDVATALGTTSGTSQYAIEASVHDGNVILRGTVASYQSRELCAWIAESVYGVRAVDNQIEVRDGVARADDAIARDAISRLHWDVQVNDANIQVEVRAGKVILKGEVASAAERRRARIDVLVRGVMGVDDAALRVAAWRPDLLRHDLFAQADDAIAKAIRDAVAYDPRASAADVHPVVQASYVTLHGSVGSVLARSSVEELAHNTVGVLFVKNELEVRPVDGPSDPELTSRVQRALSRNPYTTGLSIRVEVSGGKVTLRGSVKSAFTRAQATTMAAGVEGVRDVDNEVVATDDTSGYVYHSFLYPYGPYAEGWYALPTRAVGTDSRIAKALLARLEWDPFVDSQNIHVKVDAAKATLSGQVVSYRQRIAASEDAYESGALFVENRLEIARRPSLHR